MAYVLSARHIKKRYGRNTVLHDVSIHVKKGGIYGLVGKNGSGKTTILRIITGLIQDYQGKVIIGDGNNKKIKIAAVINDPSLFLNMSAQSNMRKQGILLGLQDVEKIKSVLSIVGLEHIGNKLVKDYSLGMTQRLKLAMALLDNPDILILDEPVNGLDPDGIADLRNLLVKLNRENGITLIISSHILSELEQIATCFGILHDGRIVKEFAAHEALQGEESLESLYMQYTRGGALS